MSAIQERVGSSADCWKCWSRSRPPKDNGPYRQISCAVAVLRSDAGPRCTSGTGLRTLVSTLHRGYAGFVNEAFHSISGGRSTRQATQ